MGFLTTRWEARYEDHRITVTRNEIRRGFVLAWDGHQIARRAWSLFGLGELRGTVEVDGKRHDVHLTISVGKAPGEGFFTDGACRITVDGRPVETKHLG